MIILGIETSCDETGAAIIETKSNSIKILSNSLSTSLELHAKTGGIIPEKAAREQIKFILPVIQKCMDDAKITQNSIDAIAVTIGPGLIGSLLVGVETGKTLSLAWDKTIIPVNHLYGHLYANFIRESSKYTTEISFPAIGLIVSGGHTDLVFMKTQTSLEWLGGTRDDAAGEAFDKIGRMLGLPYPAGRMISELGELGDPKTFKFPRPMINSGDFDFSFSGLKTAARNEIQKYKDIKRLSDEEISNLCACVEQAIVDVLVSKTIKACKKYNVKSVLLGGGVAANKKLRLQLSLKIKNLKLKINLQAPPANLCTDNAAMIAAAGFFNYVPKPWNEITANPELYFDSKIVTD